MEVKNPGLAFNKWVFHRLNASNGAGFKGDTKTLHLELLRLPLDQTAVNQLDFKSVFNDDIRKFSAPELTVTWPGLLTGLGYGHGAKTEAGNTSHPLETEMKNGFFFDFTTGIPVLPGSSVKGILRSFFPGRFTKERIGGEKKVTAIKKAVEERIIEVLNKEVPTDGGWYPDKVKKLEDIIFEGKNGKDKEGNDIYLPSSKQDIFLDAYPCEGVEADVFVENPPKPVKIGNLVQKLFLGEDVITPHRHPLKDPVPLKHLKILPGVKMKFQFLLNDLGMPAKDKEKLFRYLLCLGGVGAKSSVGFGQLTDALTRSPESFYSDDWYINFDDLDTKGWEGYDAKSPKPSNGDVKSTSVVDTQSGNNTWPELNSLKVGDLIGGTVLNCSSGSMTIALHVKGVNSALKISGKMELKSILQLKIKNVQGKPEKGNYSITQVEIVK